MAVCVGRTPPSPKKKFTGKRKKSGINYHRKKFQTSSVKGAVAVHATPDANHVAVAVVI
jgi:hypothetical protein